MSRFCAWSGGHCGLEPPRLLAAARRPQDLQRRATRDATDKLLLNIRTTVDCRFRAARRLNWRSKAAFFATTVFSLGLVLVPLLQQVGIDGGLNGKLLSAAQIFLGVAVLVYSVYTYTAQFDQRADRHQQCADKLKQLTQKLEREYGSLQKALDRERTEWYLQEYARILESSEPHEETDYHLARLSKRSDYPGRLHDRFWIWSKARVAEGVFFFLAPLSLIVIEALLIARMLKHGIG